VNQHLNIFRFYNESVSKEFIENNLSRAFALCLKNDPLFLTHYLRTIISSEDFEFLFSVYSSESKFNIDLQIDMESIDLENIRKVYAIAMTAKRDLEMSDFLQHEYCENKKMNITDIFITIKDIAFVVEVKKDDVNCKAQLYNQIYPFLKLSPLPTVIAINFSWQDVMDIMEKVVTIESLTQTGNVFINDFLRFSEVKYPEWFKAKPFFVLPFSSDRGSIGYYQLVKRLKQCISLSQNELSSYNDRLAISAPFDWASEVQADFETYDLVNEYVVFYIWPGNTKGQGYNIYTRKLDWIQKEHLEISGSKYEIDIAYNIKFSHFNKFVSGLTFYQRDINKVIHTPDNFYNMSGKWERNDWKEFEEWMDQYFKSGFNWRNACGWHDKFLKGGKAYFTISLGFEVALYVPFSEFKQLDKSDYDIKNVAKKLDAIVDAFRNLI
jgi:hypothetical protein